MAYSQPHNDFVNPADIFSSYNGYGISDPPIKTDLDSLDTNFMPGNLEDWTSPSDFNNSHQDSAVDLMGYYNALSTYPRVKTEDSLESFFDTHHSTSASNPSNTPSPHGDMIFSNANSPGDYPRDLSQTSSPEANSDVKPADNGWEFADGSMIVPEDPPTVHIEVDKNKTRAETQIKTTLVLDPLPRQYQWIRFPRHTLSKSKQLATSDEIETNEEGDAAVRLELTLVCATAVEKQAGLDRALRRARGEEQLPRRPRGTQVSEIDKDDAAHPQNGGAVVICEGCKERERKRYDRKKKRNQEEENEWTNYEDDRIIMINEKEFKRWQEPRQDRHQYGPDAKEVEFAMRITCYCRHQEEKSPVGYKVIFTFRDTKNNVIAQKVSDIIQITDDHKNRELPVVESITTDLSIHTPGRQEMLPTQYAHPNPMYNYSAPPVYGMYSQPTTPIIPDFQSPLSPMNGQFSQSATPILSSQQPHQSAFTFNAGPIAAPTPTPSYVNHQRYQSYTNLNSNITTPMLSPTEQFAPQVGYPMHRPHSMDSFASAFAGLCQQQTQNQYPHNFASQPPSRNVSRPASPSWEQGASRSKKMRAVPGFFMVEDPDNE